MIFAEPVTGNKPLDTGLLPGDRLLEVNRRNVETSSREDIIDIIRSSGNSVTLKVRRIFRFPFALISFEWGGGGGGVFGMESTMEVIYNELVVIRPTVVMIIGVDIL